MSYIHFTIKERWCLWGFYEKIYNKASDSSISFGKKPPLISFLGLVNDSASFLFLNIAQA